MSGGKKILKKLYQQWYSAHMCSFSLVFCSRSFMVVLFYTRAIYVDAQINWVLQTIKWICYLLSLRLSYSLWWIHMLILEWVPYYYVCEVGGSTPPGSDLCHVKAYQLVLIFGSLSCLQSEVIVACSSFTCCIGVSGVWILKISLFHYLWVILWNHFAMHIDVKSLDGNFLWLVRNPILYSELMNNSLCFTW
jgi:hypothetical protein